MSVLGWMSAVGALLLFMALMSAPVQRLPISTSLIYLIVGLVLGPAGFGLLRMDVEGQRTWMEVLTEVAVIVSLFVGGLKLRLPLRHPTWRPALLLAGPVMLLSIVGVALIGSRFLGLPLFEALLLGAILAPTDPVLASAVAVSDAGDHDQVRFALSGEAGLNDGAAFPFIIFALLGLQHGGPDGWIGGWFLHRIVWAIPAGLLIGYVLGRFIGRFAIGLRSRQRDTGAPSDFLVLALVALSYAAAEVVGGWGFLATFAAGVGLRHAELDVVNESPHPEVHRSVQRWFAMRGESDEMAAHPHPPAETLVTADMSAESMRQPAVSAGVLVSEALSFGDTLERLLEVLLVVVVGIALADAWYVPGVGLALALFVIVRPLATEAVLSRTDTTRAQRGLLSWFGIRGIGSLYYLTYALNHGVEAAAAMPLVRLVLTVVACSIIVHGISVTPILDWYERTLAARARAAEA